MINYDPNGVIKLKPFLREIAVAIENARAEVANKKRRARKPRKKTAA